MYIVPQVLRTALERSHGIKLISSDSEEIRRSEEDLLNEQVTSELGLRV